MSRTIAPPDPSVKTIDRFYGEVTDRNSNEIDDQEFTQLLNTVNQHLGSLNKRYGSTKVFGETHTNSATKVISNPFTYIQDNGTAMYLKVLDDGTVHKSTGGAWSQITASAPGGGFTNATTWIAQMRTKKTGASADISKTADSADATKITDSDAGLTVNAHVEKVVTISGENKLISGNSATNVYVKERFDDTPSGTYEIRPRSHEFFLANGTEFYKCNGTTFTALQTSTFAYAFEGIVAHENRLYGWVGNRMHYSDAGLGEHFSRNSYKDYQTDVQCAATLGGDLLVYEENQVTAQRGDSPDNFQWTVQLNIGTKSPKTVRTYRDMQFFLNDIYGVCIISVKSLSDEAGKEPLSVSDGYKTKSILNHTAAQIAAASAEIHNGRYYLCVDDDWYVLDIAASLEAPRDEDGNIRWIWTTRDYPAALDAHTMGHYGTKFVVGSQDTGQVYEIDNPAATDDDGTAITWTIDKQDWLITKNQVDKTFWSIKTNQPTTASQVNMDYYMATDGAAYGTRVERIDLNTAASFRHEVVFPNGKHKGTSVNVKIEESGSNGGSPIERIELLYQPDIIY